MKQEQEQEEVIKIEELIEKYSDVKPYEMFLEALDNIVLMKDKIQKTKMVTIGVKLTKEQKENAKEIYKFVYEEYKKSKLQKITSSLEKGLILKFFNTFYTNASDIIILSNIGKYLESYLMALDFKGKTSDEEQMMLFFSIFIDHLKLTYYGISNTYCYEYYSKYEKKDKKVLDILKKLNENWNNSDSKLLYDNLKFTKEEEKAFCDIVFNELKNEPKLESYAYSNIKYSLGFNDKVSKNLPMITSNEATISKTSGIKKLIKNGKDDIEVFIENKLELFDTYVLSAVYTITKDKTYFSVSEVKKTLIGDFGNEVIDKETKKTKQKGNVKTGLDDKIETSIEKMRKTDFSLSILNELNSTFKKPLEEEVISKLKLRSPLLPLNVLERTINGAVIKTYEYIGKVKPLYFVYIDGRNQLIYKPPKMLAIPNFTNNDKNVVIKNYVINKICNLQYELNNGDNISNLSCIVYETLFKELKIELKENDRHIKKDIRETIKKILEHLKEKEYIISYEETKDNKGSFTGVKFKLKKNNKLI